MTIPKQNLFGVEFSNITQSQAIEHILSWSYDSQPNAHMVVTPNVHFVVMQQRNPDFKEVLNSASLCVVDGKPIFWASRWLGQPLREVITGSDLVPALFKRHSEQTSNTPLKVFLLGAGTGVAERAAEAIHKTYQGVQVVGVHSPPFGFERNPNDCESICDQIRSSQADLLILGLGAPKQEFWAKNHLHKTGVKVALCVGATIDFMAGEKSRAPRWMQKVGLEWLFRALSEPKRLGKRYLNDGLALPQLIWAEYRKTRKLKRFRI